MKQRNEAIDILKGIGIILVLTAHSLEGVVSQFAYTFHMPLFFIVMGFSMMPGYMTFVIVISFIGGLIDGILRIKKQKKECRGKYLKKEKYMKVITYS